MIALRRVAGLGLTALAVGIMGVVFACAREAVPVDSRTLVPLDAEQRAAVLGEMRTMLGSLDGVLRSIARWDTAGIRAAALRSGTAAAADPALERILPPPWLELAARTHGGFDSLALVVGGSSARDSVLASLSRLTPACVSCHAQYRLP